MNAPPKFRPLVNTIGTILPVIAAYGVYVLCVMYSFAVVGLSLFFGLLRRDNATLADTAWAAGVYHFPVDDAFGRARCGEPLGASASGPLAGDDCAGVGGGAPRSRRSTATAAAATTAQLQLARARDPHALLGARREGTRARPIASRLPSPPFDPDA